MEKILIPLAGIRISCGVGTLCVLFIHRAAAADAGHPARCEKLVFRRQPSVAPAQLAIRRSSQFSTPPAR